MTARDDAEAVATFVLERSARRHRRSSLAGPRHAPLPFPQHAPSIAILATRRVLKLPDAAPRALVAWARGERPAVLLRHAPTPRQMLELQARGARCVSLLPDGAPTAPHADELDFVVHDLCHLEKFVDPLHHEEQVGFFALVVRALDDARFRAIEATLDARWAAERDAVLADMNGAAPFLFLALKSRLLLATRRAVARARGEIERRGELDADERGRFDDALEALLDGLAMTGEVRDAARTLRSRDDAEVNAPPIVAHFVERRRAVLAASNAPAPREAPSLTESS